MERKPADRTPTRPGEMLLEEFLKPMNLGQQELAGAIRVSGDHAIDRVALR